MVRCEKCNVMLGDATRENAGSTFQHCWRCRDIVFQPENTDQGTDQGTDQETDKEKVNNPIQS